ncbi:MAG TPA: LTA synthase family protein [Chitinophagaceae bacterium]|nr:LTA synthase family protein [Chitinophagaceae bacterium]
MVTLVAFRPEGENIDGLVNSFLLGLRYDLRWISILLMPIVIGSLTPGFSPFYSRRNKKLWTWYLAIVSFFVFFFFAADFGCFSYNKTRLNASALNFAEDPKISVIMLWQSYPMFWLLLALVVAVFMLRWMFWKTHLYVVSKTEGKGIQYQRRSFLVAIIVLAISIHGSLSAKPLTWKKAFEMKDGFTSYLALNPLQNFFTTLKFRNPEFNRDKAENYFNVLADWMELPAGGFSYNRVYKPNAGSVTTQPNVVLVICESFSMYKSSLSGNPLNTTPYFKSLSDSGVFFERCFTPHFSTARGLFATITGIPDVQLSKFSTRNPLALDQHTIINDFKDYTKMYFLGGSPSFNNFEGLIRNINGVQMFTEGKFTTTPVNVWGISDKDLFAEANQEFAKQRKPFFAIVQTADNHRPFMIPETEKDFRRTELPIDTLRKYGFESVEEYNSFRYADFSVKSFLEAAKKEAYFKNTIFVFVGDHGVAGNAREMYPEMWTKERLTDEHVPLLFYAPGLLKPSKEKKVVSQIDVLPSIAGLTGQTYVNTTLGRNVLDPKTKNHYAFIIHHDEGQIGMVTDQYYFTKNINFSKEELHVLPGASYSVQQQDSIKQKLSQVTTAFYETAKWMLMNNKPEAAYTSKPIHRLSN